LFVIETLWLRALYIPINVFWITNLQCLFVENVHLFWQGQYCMYSCFLSLLCWCDLLTQFLYFYFLCHLDVSSDHVFGSVPWWPTKALSFHSNCDDGANNTFSAAFLSFPSIHQSCVARPLLVVHPSCRHQLLTSRFELDSPSLLFLNFFCRYNNWWQASYVEYALLYSFTIDFCSTDKLICNSANVFWNH
jgi:hypothetical protein